MPTLHDPELPLLPDLLDPIASRPLIEAVVRRETESIGIQGVSITPGRVVTVRYRVTMGAGEPISLTAMHGPRLPEGGIRVASQGDEVAVWRFPDDPALPGLQAVLGGEPLDTLLAAFGVNGPADTRVRAYQPGRRAVVEIRTPRHRLFAKVVRPKRVAELQGIHTALSDTLPIPRSLGWEPRLGIVVLEAVPGSSIAAALLGGAPAGVAGPEDLIGLLELLSRCRVESRPRGAPIARAPDHAATIALIAPDAGAAAAAVAEAVTDAPEEPPITAHRDFHTSQLIVHEGRLRLVDVDTVGEGTRADDLAMLLAQVTCLARPGPSQGTVRAYLDHASQRFEEHVSAGSLRLRTAAAILGLAQGPFRVQAPDWREEVHRRVSEARDLVRA